MNICFKTGQWAHDWSIGRMRLLALLSIVSSLALFSACSKDQKRSSGSEAEHEDHDHEGETTGETTGGETTGSTDSGTSVPYEKTLEDCQSQGLAWIAVGDVGGKKQGVCGAQLLDWCCTYDEVMNRFDINAGLKTYFDDYINGTWKNGTGEVTNKKLRLYHCSYSNNKFEFHFALIEGNTRYYGNAYWDAPAKQTGKARSECPAPTTDSLKAVTDGGSGTTDGTADGTADGGTTDGTADGTADGGTTGGTTAGTTDGSTGGTTTAG